MNMGKKVWGWSLILACAGLASPVMAQTATDSPNDVQVLHQPSEEAPTAPAVEQDQAVSSESEDIRTGYQVILPDSAPGSTVEVVSTMAKVNPGPAPTFEALDVNRDRRLSEREALGYPLLANDFLYASHHTRWISPARYARWLEEM